MAEESRISAYLGTWFGPLRADQLIWLLGIAIALAVVLSSFAILDYWGDVDHYWKNIQEWYADGLVPYKDYVFEYPPLSMLVFLIPRLVSWDLGSFHYAFTIFAALTYLLMAKAVMDLTDDIPRIRNIVRWMLLLMPFLAWQFIITRNDIFAAALVVFALIGYMKGHKTTAYILIGMAAMIKIYPLIFVFAFFVNELYGRDLKSAIWCLFISALTCIVIELPFFIADPSTAFDYLSYHSDRPIQIESVAATFMYIAQFLGLTSLEHVSSYGSDNLVGELPDMIDPYMNKVLLVAMAAVCLWILIRVLRSELDVNGRNRVLCLSCMALVTAFVVFSKVYSGQYMIWIYTLMPLILWTVDERTDVEKLSRLYMVFAITSLIAACCYSGEYWDTARFIVPEAVKNLMSIVLLVVTLVMIKRETDVRRTH